LIVIDYLPEVEGERKPLRECIPPDWWLHARKERLKMLENLAVYSCWTRKNSVLYRVCIEQNSYYVKVIELV